MAARRLAAHDGVCRVRACPRGCGSLLPLQLLPSHAARDCPETLVQCGIADVMPAAPPAAGGAAPGVQLPALRCPFVCRRRELATHAAACPFRPVACAACGGVASQRRAAAHAAVCPSEMAACPAGCGAVLRRGVLAAHIGAACPAKTVACDWHDFGAHARKRRCQLVG